MKDYELRRCGSQIVFRRFMKPFGQFETEFVANEVVKTDIPGLTVLKRGFSTYALLRENEQTCVKYECVDYILRNGLILFRVNKWYWWRDDFERILLGMAIDNQGLLFLKTTDFGDVFSYFSEGKPAQLCVKILEPLQAKEAGCLTADICRILTDEGWRYVSVISKYEQELAGGFFGEYQKKYKVILSEKPYASIADYYHFVKTFQSSKSGFGRVADFEEKFAAALWEGKEPFFDVTLWPSFTDCGENFGVKVIAWTRKMFEGETKGVYLVLAKDVSYKQIADEVEIGQFKDNACLFIRYEGKEDKIVYQPKFIGAKLKLIK